MSDKPVPRKRVLVVENDDAFRERIRQMLLDGGYLPVVATSCKVAQQLLIKEKFDGVISEMVLPDGNGLELLKSLRQKSQAPVLVMTSLASLSPPRDSQAFGRVRLLHKPFGMDILLAALRDFFPAPEEPEATKEIEIVPADKRYCKVSIEEFISGKEIKFDIYIQLSSTNYVKVAHQGEKLSLDQIQSYQAKGIHHLYLTREDFAQYLKFSVKLGQCLKNSSTIPRDRKLKFLQQTSKLLLQSAFADQINPETLEQGIDVVESTVEILAENDAFFGLMDLMSSAGEGDPLYTHSLAVALYASLMANKLGWTSPSTIFFVAGGALFHDIGKKEIPVELMAKIRPLQSREERALYETHPLRGAQILRAVPDTPDEIIRIVQQHHENESGGGYPFRVKRGKIYPLAKLVSVADEFCDALKLEPKIDHAAVIRVFEKLVMVSREVLDPSMIAALMSVFNLTAPKEIRSSISVSVDKAA